LRERKTWLAVSGAVLVVLGFWIGGKHHPAGFVLAVVPIAIWAGLHAVARLRARRGRS